jgi:hypothetical protein
VFPNAMTCPSFLSVTCQTFWAPMGGRNNVKGNQRADCCHTRFGTNIPSLLPPNHLHHPLIIIHGRILNHNLALPLAVADLHLHTENPL